VVATGATAVLALAGKPLPIGRFRGPAELQGRRGYITVHPSYLLRLPDRDAKDKAYLDFVGNLRSIREMAGTAMRCLSIDMVHLPLLLPSGRCHRVKVGARQLSGYPPRRRDCRS
jgi:hypothetical protein